MRGPPLPWWPCLLDGKGSPQGGRVPKVHERKLGAGRGQFFGRSVINHAQARRLLDAVRAREPSGPRLVAFYAVIYYAALRPEEAINLREDNIVVPPLVWNDKAESWDEPVEDRGELHFCTAAPEVSGQWSDSGASREERRLKARPVGEWRRVPMPPQLTKLIRSHLKEFPPIPGGRVFSGVQGGDLPTITYRRAWAKARKAALTEAEYTSPLAKRIYDLRHACVSTWLNGGVPPTQVANWAGHGVDVLLKIYAKCIEAQDESSKRRIGQALREGG